MKTHERRHQLSTTTSTLIPADWLERELKIAAGTAPLRDTLAQAEHYAGHLVSQMSATEALIVLALLERHASTLHRGALAECLIAPEPAQIAELHRELRSISAQQWLCATPLHHALTERASR